jgi:hypothetical protein
MRQFLYDSNAPAAVAIALRATYPSGFASHLERRSGSTVGRMLSPSHSLRLYSTILFIFVDKGEPPMGSRRNRGATLARAPYHSSAQADRSVRRNIHLLWDLCCLHKLGFFHDGLSSGIDHPPLRADGWRISPSLYSVPTTGTACYLFNVLSLS